MPNVNIDMLLRSLGGGAPGYPTKEEVMAEPHPTHKPAVIKLCKRWKKEVWFPLRATEPDEQAKFMALKTLLQTIAREAYGKPVEVNYFADTGSCSYRPGTKTITINKSLSILSSLHELGHHLFGADEHKACRWSVHLFRKSFPKAYSLLEWKGHMLVRKQEECSVS